MGRYRRAHHQPVPHALGCLRQPAPLRISRAAHFTLEVIMTDTTIARSVTGRSPEAVFMHELINAVLEHFGFSIVAPYDHYIVDAINGKKGSVMCDGEFALLNVLRFLARQPTSTIRMWAAPWRLALADTPRDQSSKPTMAMSYTFAGDKLVTLTGGLFCPNCRRELHATNIEVDASRVRIICAGCHRDILVIEKLDHDIPEWTP